MLSVRFCPFSLPSPSKHFLKILNCHFTSILWTVDAEQDRERIYDYLDERNPIAAIELDDLIREKVSLLAHNNLMGRTGQKKGTRELVVHPHYVVVYDITENVRISRKISHWI